MVGACGGPEWVPKDKSSIHCPKQVDVMIGSTQLPYLRLLASHADEALPLSTRSEQLSSSHSINSFLTACLPGMSHPFPRVPFFSPSTLI